MSSAGAWDDVYSQGGEVRPYGDTRSYEMGAEWLKDCELVEDWGAGFGWFAQTREGKTVSLDGSSTPAVDSVVDLTTYRSEVPGVFMRHVLEHNADWSKILDNALGSFTERMCLVIFTPWQAKTRVLAQNAPYGVEVPDIGFKRERIMDAIVAAGVKCQEVVIENSATVYGVEYVLKLER